jgi:hypothetical protein
MFIVPSFALLIGFPLMRLMSQNWVVRKACRTS